MGYGVMHTTTACRGGKCGGSCAGYLPAAPQWRKPWWILSPFGFAAGLRCGEIDQKHDGSSLSPVWNRSQPRDRMIRARVAALLPRLTIRQPMSHTRRVFYGE